MSFLMGIDIGTSNIKASVFSVEGEEIAGVSIEHPLESPRPGWVEQDPDRWWEGVRDAIAAALSKGRVPPADIKCVGVSSQSWGVVPVDGGGRAIHPAVLWLDRRSVGQSRAMEERLRKEGMDVLVDPSYIVPKLAWFKEREPDVYRRTGKFLQVNAFVNRKLCAASCMDLSQEDPLQIYIRDKGRFGGMAGCYEALGLDPGKTADVKNPAEVIGTLTREAARETGLAAGTPVVAGAMDTSASALGMGIVRAGQTLHVAGQAGAIGVCLDKPLFDRRLCIHNHVVPDMWLVVGVMVATGASMRWIRDVFAGTETSRNAEGAGDPFETLSEAAGRSADGANGVIFLPYLMGERTPVWDYDARGVFFGLSLKTRKEDLIRAVMEGVAFALRHNVEVLKAAGIEIDEIACAGGAIHSDLWNQIKSDVTRKTLVCAGDLPATTLGAAMLAGRGVGIEMGSFRSGATRRGMKVYRPREDAAARYDRLFGIYKRIYVNLKEEFGELASASASGEPA